MAIAQPSFQNHLGILQAQALVCGKFLGKFTYANEKKSTSVWKSPRRVNFDMGHPEMRWGEFLIKAVTTLDAKCSVQSKDGHLGCSYLTPGIASTPHEGQLHPSGEDSTELDEKEQLRRLRISKANRGNRAWNKGRKHSAETLQRIRERTKLAMQDPKVKMKLRKLGHFQSKETRTKIGIGVRLGWQRRRHKKILQETCYFEWQNLVAEASRKGAIGEEELQWDSYETLDQMLEKEWLESVEQKKKMLRSKGSNRAPKPLEQRRKISEAISAKWADPEYRERVCSALTRYYGKPAGAGRKPRRRPSGSTQSAWRIPAKKKANDSVHSARSETNSQNHEPKLRRKNTLPYKDPLVNSKLKMIKNIRAHRASAEREKSAAVERAKLLIAEAEKAAKALEIAATRSSLARSSLMEARKLIDEAAQSIKTVERRQISSPEESTYNSLASPRLINYVEETNPRPEAVDQADHREVNDIQAIDSNSSDDEEFHFGSYTLQNLLNGSEEVLQTSCQDYSLPQLGFGDLMKRSDSPRQLVQLELNGNINSQKTPQPIQTISQSTENGRAASSSVTTTKKWVRGRLLEVSESD
ncbi:uncharacterized protein LOC131165851 [Malania oleifera]|uniref:uncharacterized protein LOC131165851 n=1 Tax=Malania oleifera TaxID=397392 RepID=UPI0025ADE4A0|nr:uncharacterized protein LOC131165851 [Malania oleifera]